MCLRASATVTAGAQSSAIVQMERDRQQLKPQRQLSDGFDNDKGSRRISGGSLPAMAESRRISPVELQISSGK